MHPASPDLPVLRGCLACSGGALPVPEQAELVAFRIAEKQVVSVFRYQGRAELLQPFRLSPD